MYPSAVVATYGLPVSAAGALTAPAPLNLSVPVTWTPGQAPGAVLDCGRWTKREAYASPARTASPAAAKAAIGVVVLPEVISVPAAL